MDMRSIRWDRRRQRYILGNGTLSDHVEFPLEATMDLSLTSLRRAMAREVGISVPSLESLPDPQRYGSYKELAESASKGPNAEVIIAMEPPWNGLFFFLTEQGHLRAHFAVDNPVVTEKATVTEITKRVLGEVCVVVEEFHYSDGDYDDPPAWYFYIICNPKGQTVGSFWRAYETLSFALTTFPRDLAQSSEGTKLALRLGHPDLLIGTPENSWLDVKSKDYALSFAAEKIKLAQDVARFANADGGVLVLGLKTSQVNGVDTISRVTPLPLPARSVVQYRSIIDAHVYPFVRGLEVFSAPCDKGELLAISIPAQPDDEKPFLVHGNLGSITNNSVKGQFISIVERRGDGAEYLGGPAVHGLLARRKRLKKKTTAAGENDVAIP